MTNETIAAKKPRLGWLDALRGFTMILVVTNHVALKSFGMQIRWSAALQFFLLFRMPLFFFISGFLAYKASRLWDARTLRELSLKKMRVQLIPTIVFFLLYLAMIPSAPFLDSLQCCSICCSLIICSRMLRASACLVACHGFPSHSFSLSHSVCLRPAICPVISHGL